MFAEDRINLDVKIDVMKKKKHFTEFECQNIDRKSKDYLCASEKHVKIKNRLFQTIRLSSLLSTNSDNTPAEKKAGSSCVKLRYKTSEMQLSMSINDHSITERQLFLTSWMQEVAWLRYDQTKIFFSPRGQRNSGGKKDFITGIKHFKKETEKTHK